MDAVLEGAPGGRQLLLGNEAIVRGALEAGVFMVSCYPGTPSSEVADTFLRLSRKMERPPFRLEYSINEKVALEVAAGCALAGAESLVAMKHVGLNVAADPLFTSAYIGMPGGMVVLSADDPGCHSSQNEQDNRNYARFAGLPMFEPATPEEARAMTIAAFAVARELEQPVLLRTTTRVSHMRGPVTFGPLPESGPRVPFRKDPGRFVPIPAVALRRHRALAAQMEKATQVSESSPFNRLSFLNVRQCAPGGGRLGIVASGVARDYLADVLAQGFDRPLAVLELGMTWPLPQNMIRNFLRACDRVLVLEEGEPLLERDIAAIAHGAGLLTSVEGKDKTSSCFGEYSASQVQRRLKAWLGEPAPEPPAPAAAQSLPGRPPNLCAGCSHRAAYYAARKVFGDDAVYSSDIGCYTLGLLPPLRAADFLLCMGSSISAGSGFARAHDLPVVAFIGDSTFFHSGMTGLANAVFNRHNLILVILDNGTTAMTGHQPNPGMVQEMLGSMSEHLDIEAIVRALGVVNCEVVGGYNVRAITERLEGMRGGDGVRVLILREPCALYARRSLKRARGAVARVASQGPEAESCVAGLACPAFYRRDGSVNVDESLCTGCMVCVQVAPGAFRPGKRGGEA